MFREMRRKDREVSRDEAEKILKSVDCGVLSVIGDSSCVMMEITPEHISGKARK